MTVELQPSSGGGNTPKRDPNSRATAIGWIGLFAYLLSSSSDGVGLMGRVLYDNRDGFNRRSVWRHD